MDKRYRTIDANWVANSYNVVYHSNDGTSRVATYSVMYDTNVNIKNITELGWSRTGYTFANTWNTMPNGNGVDYTVNQANVKNLVETGDYHLYAKWNGKTITVKFNANGGVGTAMADKTYTYGEGQSLMINSYTKTNYLFLGWSLNSGDNNTVKYRDRNEVDTIILNETQNPLNLYAVWHIKNDTIRVAYEASRVENDTARVNGTYRRIVRNVAKGWRFEKISSSKYGYSPSEFENVDGDIIYEGTRIYVATTAYATFTMNNYEIVYNGNGGVGNMPHRQVGFEDSVTLDANTFTKFGYEFIGWDTNPTGNVVVYSNSEPNLKGLADSGEYPIL